MRKIRFVMRSLTQVHVDLHYPSRSKDLHLKKNILISIVSIVGSGAPGWDIDQNLPKSQFQGWCGVQKHGIDVYGMYFDALRPSELPIPLQDTQINTVREIESDFPHSVTIDSRAPPCPKISGKLSFLLFKIIPNLYPGNNWVP